MADDLRGGRGYPPRENPDDSHYPPPPDDEDDRRPPYQQPPPVAQGGMTLPSLQYPAPGVTGYAPEPQRYPEQRYASADQRYPPDQRSWSSESPTNPNGYPPPPSEQRYQLPPVHAPQDRARYDDRRQYDERRQYDDRRQYNDQYFQGQPPPYGYRYPPGAAYPPPYDYARAGANAPPPAVPQPQQQAAPRQRTSIACRYCRKRKIRCSGYANTNNGKCTNCDKLRIDCVFQPVSSNSSAAFVPVSAVPGGVPPGTPLYGAYGQPLPPAPGQLQQQRAYPPLPSDYSQGMHSPTGQYAPYDDRDPRDPGRRRTRPPEEEHALRLPPPNYPVDEDPRRRSPASTHSSATPPTAYRDRQYPQGYEQDRTPTPHRNSPGGPPPPAPAQSQSQQPPPPSSSNNPMSLNHLMGPDSHDRSSSHDIDRNMLGRLNKRSS
ncbi:hypothetical protein B0T25DRAFT_63946 [Lasiosphaeria hispida]|uniref:Zn(2)-C6 fungal-type domain-containing protein n=1 Tax=Lasiosphaeria hispida TaxID=260671 RepID=A0AAJ0HWX6_9PEZI|nr:hypothetical protein B0T25DRAFT_63946 [Lasiosphaeria hispida]